MSSLLHLSGVHLYLFKWIFMMMDTTIKGSLFLAVILLINRNKKGIPPGQRYIYLIIAMISFCVLPMFFSISQAYISPVRHYSITDFQLPKLDIRHLNSSSKLPQMESIKSISTAYKATAFVTTIVFPAFLLWIFGFTTSLLKLFIGLSKIKNVVYSADKQVPQGVSTLLEQLKEILGIRQNVKMVFQSTVKIPVTTGIFHPIILLPLESIDWPVERVKVILLHELCHIKRRDNLTFTIGYLIASFYWFNPVLWKAVCKVREEREHACDERVLQCGIQSFTYADHLLKIIEFAMKNKRSEHPAVIVSSLAQSSHIEHRIYNILNRSGQQKELQRRNLWQYLLLSSGVFIFCSLFTAFHFEDQSLPNLWPAAYNQGQLISTFNESGMNSEEKQNRNLGIFIHFSQHCTPIVAAADGEVLTVDVSKSYGQDISLQHAYGFQSVYESVIEVMVYPGDKVMKGQIIAYTGDNNQIGYMVKQGKQFINPMLLIRANKLKGEK